jgi:(1->4)-alpha-D-glucan 1-alpha-D-glucosylmutase
MTTAPHPPRAAARPSATYRVQLHAGFPFGAARELVPYLARLGVSHLHLSPVLQAAPGSTHGYDVVDHSRVSADLGGEEGLRALAATAHAHGLGIVVDTVPNHMAVPVPEHLNRPLWSVLRDGPQSPYAAWFDVDWSAGPGGRLVLPVLGGPPETELGHLRRGTLGDETVLRYYDHTFPVRPGTEHLPLPELLDAQRYRLVWWRLAPDELNYRRFFTITGLIGVRVEEPEVFAATHEVLLRLAGEGVVDGLRIDHPDGLADPRGYLRRLDRATGGRWTVVEKILTGDEHLPADWPCAGTTGYDALRRVDDLFLCPDGVAELGAVFTRYTAPDTGWARTWPQTVEAAARELLRGDLRAEVRRLARLAAAACAAGAGPVGHTEEALREAVEEVLVAFPVYRPYVVPGEPAPAGDAELLKQAAETARGACATAAGAAAVDAVLELALGTGGRGPEHDDFAPRFAQVSSAVRAKSVEDTAFYRWFPLLSLGEVGGDPGAPVTGPEGFHAFCARLQRDWPTTGTVLSTHDTKRSGDQRARLAVLSEAPEEFARWLDEMSRRGPGGDGPPDRHAEYLVWQTLLGVSGDPEGFGANPERMVEALRKALREAAVRTRWTDPDEPYESAALGFAERALRDALPLAAEFMAGFAAAERANVLGSALVHLTMPGVPEVYQGTEALWHSLVDPDNRRPVPFAELARRLEAVDAAGTPDGTPAGPADEKLRVTATALRLRRRRPEWFGPDAGYVPVEARGPAAAHAVAFCRAGSVLTVVTRLAHRLARGGGWRETALPLPDGPAWTDVLTGRAFTGPVPLAELLAELPIALLTRHDDGEERR